MRDGHAASGLCTPVPARYAQQLQRTMHSNGRSTMHNNGPSACAYERKERDGRRQARPPNNFAGMRHQARIGVSFEARKQEARKRYDRACAPAVSSPHAGVRDWDGEGRR